MSFQDLGGSKAGGHVSKSQPKQRRVEEDSSFEREIRAHIQKMQEGVRMSSEQLERMQRGFSSKRVRESIDKSLADSRESARSTEQLFRDWTIHLAGEPTKRHRSKFSMEKLQKAFEDEVEQLKDLARRVSAVEQDLPERAHPGPLEFQPMGGEQGMNEEECALLESTTDAWATQAAMQEEATMMGRIAQEREEGIKRIQTQVGEVNQIVRDLASIVIEQGTQLDTIEQQAEVASISTKEATRELRKAVDRHRSVREYFFCLLAAAVLVFVFIIVPHLHSAGHIRHDATEIENAPIIIKQEVGRAAVAVKQGASNQSIAVRPKVLGAQVT